MVEQRRYHAARTRSPNERGQLECFLESWEDSRGARSTFNKDVYALDEVDRALAWTMVRGSNETMELSGGTKYIVVERIEDRKTKIGTRGKSKLECEAEGTERRLSQTQRAQKSGSETIGIGGRERTNSGASAVGWDVYSVF